MSCANKIALVTGGAQGLGKAFVLQLLKCGASVSIVDLNKAVGQQTLKELQDAHGKNKVAFFAGNVTVQADMERVFQSTKETFGGLDIVINNAGLGGEAGTLWERTIDVNLKGSIRCTLLALESLRKDRGGRGGVIVNVASMAGINPNPCSPTYSASKSALISYSLSWAKNPEIVANGVRINVLAPAFVETPLMANLDQADNCMLPDLAKMIVQKVGIMTPESVAAAMMELIEPEHNKHGQVLKISKNEGCSYHTVE